MKKPRTTPGKPARPTRPKKPKGHPFEPEEQNPAQRSDAAAVAQPSTSPP